MMSIILFTLSALFKSYFPNWSSGGNIKGKKESFSFKISKFAQSFGYNLFLFFICEAICTVDPSFLEYAVHVENFLNIKFELFEMSNF